MNGNEEAKRLIEVAFPLKQVSPDSVYEKNVRHGLTSTQSEVDWDVRGVKKPTC